MTMRPNKLLTSILSLFLLASCMTSGKPDHIIKEEVPVYITPPRELMLCKPPVRLTPELLEQIQTPKDKITLVELPNYIRHEACYNNSQDLQEWDNTHKSLEVATQGDK